MLQMLTASYWANNAVERGVEGLVQQGAFLYLVACLKGLFCYLQALRD
jgi:hypothetical protein